MKTFVDILTPLLPAVIAFVGVIVGAVVSGRVAYLRDRRNEAAETRVAVRLLLDEIRLARSAVEAMITFRFAPPHLYGVDSWTTYRSALARSLSHDDWRSVSTAVTALLSINVQVATSRAQGAPVALQTKTMEQVRDLLDNALRVLGTLAPTL